MPQLTNERAGQRGRRLRGGAWAGLQVAIGQGGPRAETRLVGARGAMVGPELRGLGSCRRRKW